MTVIMNKSDYIDKVNTLLNDTETYQPHDATSAKFYGLPKIHKENIPLRPIVSLPGSPTYLLSKYLAMVLHPLVKTSPHTIDNAMMISSLKLKILNLNQRKS